MQLFTLLAFPLLAIAQSSSSSASASSTSALPAINTGNNQYSYAGCYNETTFEPGNPRALTMGVQLNALWVRIFPPNFYQHLVCLMLKTLMISGVRGYHDPRDVSRLLRTEQHEIVRLCSSHRVIYLPKIGGRIED